MSPLVPVPALLSSVEVSEAIAWNRARLAGWPFTVAELQTWVGTSPDGDIGPLTVAAVAQWQKRHRITVDGKVGAETIRLLNPDSEVDDVASATLRDQHIALGADAVARARQDFPKRNLSHTTVRRIQRVIGEAQDGKWGSLSIQALAAYQHANKMLPSGILDASTLALLRADPAWDADPIHITVLDAKAQNDVVEYTKTFEAARGAPEVVYGSCNRDGEYEGLFDAPRRDSLGRAIPPSQRKQHAGFKPHSASQYGPTGGWHVGLSYGAWQAAQEFGTLGEQLLLFRHRDAALFDRIMGGTASAKAVLLMTNASGNRVGKRSPRVQPLDGADLWQEPWLGRFRELAHHEVFRQAQRDVIISQYLVPACEVAAEHRLLDQGSLAVLFDISIQHGVGGMNRYVRAAISNLRAAKVRTWDSVDLTAPDARRPTDHIERVIEYGLPEAHRARRRNLLRMASPGVVYTLESIRACPQPVPNSLLKQLAAAARSI